VVGDANPDVVLAGAPDRLAFGQREHLVAGGSLVLGGSGPSWPAARPGSACGWPSSAESVTTPPGASCWRPWPATASTPAAP
jgi:hypothetical protein